MGSPAVIGTIGSSTRTIGSPKNSNRRSKVPKPQYPTPPSGPLRLLHGTDSLPVDASYRGHIEKWGKAIWPTKHDRTHLLKEIEQSGLRGHGGAWFPVARKWVAATQSRKAPIVVVNGSEGEPASTKDATLLSQTPHLVIDGAMFAASCVNASKVIFFVPPAATKLIQSALKQRGGTDPVRASVVASPAGYVTGEQSAVINYLNGGPPETPQFTQLRPTYVSGVDKGPTLLHNVETVAHVGLISRFGPGWFRQMGTQETPGTALLSVAGAVMTPKVLEVNLAHTLSSAIAGAGGPANGIQGVLLGGYGGSWLSPKVLNAPLSQEGLRKYGASLGAGVIFVLPKSVCPLAQVAHLVSYLDSQGAGQCGPCFNGLAELTQATRQLAFSTSKQDLVGRINNICGLVEGRGACHHPDGVARMIRSALSVFAADIEEHRTKGPCGRSTKMMLPTGSEGPRPLRQPLRIDTTQRPTISPVALPRRQLAVR